MKNFLIAAAKAQFDKKQFILLQLDKLCEKISRDNDYLTFLPKDGKLKELFVVLKYHKITFNLHQSHSVTIS